MSEVVLKIGKQQYGGWKSVSIRRSIEEVTGSFQITHTERWSEKSQKRPIARGSECRLLIDGQQVIKGYVDESNPAYDSGSHEITVFGRDKTGDLADCSAVPKQYKKQTLLQIVQDIARPFSIRVTLDGDQGEAFADFDVEDESCFNAIERAARQRELLVMSDTNGNLVLGKPSGELMPAGLVFGKNIWQGGGRFSDANRFSKIIVHSQIQGDDNFNGAATVSPQATALDKSVKRYRPLIIQAEDQVTGKMLQRRANWEARVREGRASTIFYSVRDWFSSGKQLWWPGWHVNVDDSYLNIKGRFLIVAVQFVIDGDGLHADLTLAPPVAYTQFATSSSGEADLWAA